MTAGLIATLPEAKRAWRRADPILYQLARDTPLEAPPLGQREPFTALAESLVHQQVSLAAGRSIWRRLEEALGGVTPGAVLAADDALLAGAGLSRQKTAYLRDLARRVAHGELDLAGLADADDDAVVTALTRVRGIGTWTAEMFLLFHLERPDVLAVKDRGLQLAVAAAYGVAPPEAEHFLMRHGARWRPHRSLASLVLWASRRP